MTKCQVCKTRTDWATDWKLAIPELYGYRDRYIYEHVCFDCFDWATRIFRGWEKP